jgi:hypothetical protein
MQLLGPLYVISNLPHQVLIDPADLDDLRVAVRHAVEATTLVPAKVEHAAVCYGPFSFSFHAVTRSDARPHWAGAMFYREQELPLFAWAGAGTLFDLHEALFSTEYVTALFNGAVAAPFADAHEAEVVWS